MASLSVVLTGVLALAGQASARILPPVSVPPHVRGTSEDLISLRRDAGDLPDETPIIQDSAKTQVLKPLRPVQATAASSDRTSALNILNENALYWAGSDGTAAELWIDMSGETEGMVDTELFEDLIESMTDCPRNGTGHIKMDFIDQLDLGTAADVWKWVNQEPDHHFYLMVGAGLCGWNEDRILYHVRDLDFIDDSNTAVLSAELTTWKKALHTFDLNIGKAAAKGLKAKRGAITAVEDEFSVADEDGPDFSIPLDADLSTKGISFSMGGVDYIGYCKNCTTSGSFDVDAKFSVGWFELDEAAVEISTQGIDATVIMDVSIKGELTDELVEKSIDLFKVSPGGISIPGIVTIGPTVGIALTAGVNAIKGGVTFTVGGTASIPPSTARLDFLDQAGTYSEGWEASFEPQPFEVDLLVEARASVALKPAVGLEISVLGTWHQPYTTFLQSSI